MYLETFNNFAGKSLDTTAGAGDDGDGESVLYSCLGGIKGVSRANIISLEETFGSLKSISQASYSELIEIPGLADTKARRLGKVFSQPFVVGGAKRRA